MKNFLLGALLVLALQAGFVAYIVVDVRMNRPRNACEGGAICENWSQIKKQSNYGN